MILEYFKKGNCQAVFTGAEKDYVYKVPLQRSNDVDSISFSFNPKAAYSFLKQGRRYQRNISRFAMSVQVLQRLEKMAKNGLMEFFPETIISSVKSNTHIISGKKYDYSGPIIKQEFVEEFFDNTVSLRSFNWQNLVDIEIELWKYGIGLGATAETWGPKNWGRIKGGSVKLVDTSHLTQNFHLVAENIRPEIMKFREKKLLSYDKIHNSIDVEEYFKFMRSYLNINTLRNNWSMYARKEKLE